MKLQTKENKIISKNNNNLNKADSIQLQCLEMLDQNWVLKQIELGNITKEW